MGLKEVRTIFYKYFSTRIFPYNNKFSHLRYSILSPVYATAALRVLFTNTNTISYENRKSVSQMTAAAINCRLDLGKKNWKAYSGRGDNIPLITDLDPRLM